MEVPGEKLLVRMWETLTDKGIGSLLRPWQTRRENRAQSESRRHELLMLAQAEKDAVDVRAGRKQYLSDGSLRLAVRDLGDDDNSAQMGFARVEPTLRLQPELSLYRAQAEEIRKEINQTKAIIYAEDQLSTEHIDPPTEKIDDDWLYAWRDNAGKTSNEDIQKLWGSVLAGEIKSPGSFSLRTLDFLKGISKQEAKLIEFSAPFVLNSTTIWNDIDTLNKAGLSYDKLLKLQELGIVLGVESTSISIRYLSASPYEFVKPFTLHGKIAEVKHPDINTNLDIEMIKLTTIGQQIVKIGHHLPNLDYFTSFCKKLVSKGYNIRIGECKYDQNDQLLVKNMEPFQP